MPFLPPGSDAIIRQHKAACLRITALLVCEELLWVGTSAGVVLTMPTTPSTISCPRAPLSPTGLGQGHTGHVRFLAAVQLPDGFNLLCPTPPPPPDTGGSAPSTPIQGSASGGSERVKRAEVEPAAEPVCTPVREHEVLSRGS